MNNIDVWGIYIGAMAFLLAWIYGFFLLKKFDLNQRWVVCIAMISLAGHCIGAYALYYYSMMIGSDSIYYFHEAKEQYQGLGYFFVFLILGYAKKYMLGKSFLGAFLVSGAISFVSSIYYLITYKILLSRLTSNSLVSKDLLFYPVLLLLCWPSYFFWSAGLIKDNFTFLAIGLILYCIANGKISISNFFTLAFAFVLGFFVRPYLFVIFSLSAILYIFISQQKMTIKIGLLFSLIILTLLLAPLLNTYIKMMHFPDFTLSHIGQYAIQQQEYMHVGSRFPVLTHNDLLVFLFLPYSFLANVFLPLGFGVSGKLTAISAIENAYFLGWVIFFVKNRKIWQNLKDKLNVMNFYLTYFFVGMSCLSLMNSNMGLAMRQKMLYVPALLICILLTYSYKKILASKASCSLSRPVTKLSV